MTDEIHFPTAQMQMLTGWIEDEMRRFNRRRSEPHTATVVDRQCADAAQMAHEHMSILVEHIRTQQSELRELIRQHAEAAIIHHG